MRILRPAAALLTVGLLAACGSPPQHSTAQRGTGQHGTGQHGARAAAAATLASQSRATADAAVPLAAGGHARIISSGGQPSVSVQPAVVNGRPTSNTTTTIDVGGDIYAIPANAKPYLGTLLDPRLFDVSYLQRAGYSRLQTLPVTITWRHASHSAVPGITSATQGTTTSGTVSSGAGLGAALTAGIRASHVLPNAPGPLAQVSRISLAPSPVTAPGSAAAGSAPSSPAVAPAVPLSSARKPAGKVYGLTVNVLGHDGRPSTDAYVMIQNLDNFNTFYTVAVINSGQLAVSVPAGPYAIEAYDATIGPYGLNDSISLLTAQTTVGENTQVTLDARAAKPVTARVPDAGAAAEQASMQFLRLSADGNGLSIGVEMYGTGVSTLLTPVAFYAMPTPRPRLGSLDFADAWDFVPLDTGLTAPDIPYSYNLNFANTGGIPSVLSHVVKAADLATVHESFPGTVDGNGDSFLVMPFNQWGQFSIYLSPGWYAFPTPTQRTDYYYGTPGTVWRQQVAASEPPLTGGYVPTAPFSPYTTYHPGEVTSDTWNGGPAVPLPAWEDMGEHGAQIQGGELGFSTDYSYVCPACRQGQSMSFEAQESDGIPGHWDPANGFGSGVLSSTSPVPGTDELKFYVNGTLTRESDFSSQSFPLLPGTAKYAINWTSTKSGAWSTLGTSVTSDWTFTSGPAKASKLPSYEYCSPDPLQSCTYLPLIFASYGFNDGLSEQVPAPGTETFTVTGFHEAGDQAPAVSHATVAVSFDDGKTWTQEPVTSLGRGRFRVSVGQPAGTGFASVRVSLSDGAGDTLRQTIIRAWALSAASDAGTEGR